MVSFSFVLIIFLGTLDILYVLLYLRWSTDATFEREIINDVWEIVNDVSFNHFLHLIGVYLFKHMLDFHMHFVMFIVISLIKWLVKCVVLHNDESFNLLVFNFLYCVSWHFINYKIHMIKEFLLFAKFMYIVWVNF